MSQMDGKNAAPDPYAAFDHIGFRCPRLGGPVNFGYCRKLKGGLPCERALICFEFKFPVDEYFRLVLKEETYNSVFAPDAPDKLTQLFETVDAAKKRLQTSEEQS